MTGKLLTVSIADVRLDMGTQTRPVNEDVVAAYMEVLENVPPGVAYRLKDGTVVLTDGFHRFIANQRSERHQITLEVRDGDLDDAILHAAGSNAEHGYHRTQEAKTTSVEMLLKSKKWGDKSVAWIFESASVSHTFATKVRDAYFKKSGKNPPEKRKGKDGKSRPSSIKVSKVQPPAREVPSHESNGTCENGSLENSVAEHSETTTPETQPSPETVKTVEVLRDAKDRPVPERLIPVFEATSTFRSILHKVGTIKTYVADLAKTPAGKELNVTTVGIDIDNLRRGIRFAIPFVVCPDCSGEGCPLEKSICRGRGWLPERAFDQLTEMQKGIAMQWFKNVVESTYE